MKANKNSRHHSTELTKPQTDREVDPETGVPKYKTNCKIRLLKNRFCVRKGIIGVTVGDTEINGCE